MKNTMGSLMIVLTQTFLGIFLYSKQLLANCDSIKYADAIIALSVTNETQHSGKIVAWTYSGDVFLLDRNLCLIRKIEIPQALIENIKQQLGSLYVLSTKTSKTSEIESTILQYEISNGKEKQHWSDSKYYIWSLSADNNRISAMSSEGDLLELRPNDFEQLAKYPRHSHYIPVSGSEPIICTAPDLTKLNWKSASCYRKGKFNWREDGDWRNMNPPFLCHNYLIQQDAEFGENRGNISVINVANGRQIIEYTSNDISALTCVDTGLAYASKSSIFVRNLPDLKEMHTVTTNSNTINSIVKIENSIFYLDDMRKIHKYILKN